ncbi:RNA 2',3'-cyclic phosphodiesterase [Paramagnetospirillum kuznetsovii]|uniref:RNA 2',3'-cyclic phosphodiesterase n=1 Tax=Paramagnetospirillum kuznetsovii TaxID=2053833 RepID=A0A364P351_9PROT|nr:RNA 2',3'-cyclic phosphodiesterase [Paramagnetospirillum kuznetsovii]RAU23779.1 RNA 2',3'-cyclic phosphodiesterase [Paramagnetospirillum kuznetsovii]
MIRLFVGLDLPPALDERIAALGVGLPGARWVPARNLHLTLRFIGEVDEDTAEEIHYGLARLDVPGFDLTLTGLGLFGDSRRAHTLWLGVETSEPLGLLARLVDGAVVRAGCKPEPRRFSPHVSLARLKEADPARLQSFISEAPVFRARTPISDFALFRSVLHRDGPEYDVLERYPLGPTPLI